MKAQSNTPAQKVTLDACASVMDAFLLKGIALREGTPGTLAPQRLAAYALGCAIIYAALEVARAIDKLNTRIDPIPTAGTDENTPPKKATGALVPRGRDPTLLQMEKEASLAAPVPQASREQLAQLKAEQAITGTFHKPNPSKKAP